MDIEADEPFWTIRRPTLTFRFTVGTDERPDTLDDGDLLVVGPAGERWCANVMTPDRIRASMDGAYFWTQGLIVVREPGVESMVHAVEDLYATYGTLDDTLPRLAPKR